MVVYIKNILIRAGKDYFESFSPETTFSYRKRSIFGHNVGFYLISDSVYKLISTPNTSITPDSYLLGSKKSYKKNVAETINSEFDAFVLPAADFLKPTQINHVKRITTLIKNLDIPICVLGLGIGIGLDANNFNDTKTNETMEKFVRAILEKSKSVGVRGELTFKYLSRIGFDENEINVLGCPSIYLNGPEYNITSPEINNDSKIALNITPSVKKYANFVEKTINKYKNYKYFMQDIVDLRLILFGEDLKDIGREHVRDYYTKILNKNKAIFPIDSRSWINELKNYEYAVGTRLHGTIASLNARIPATLIIHDSRTQEIADYHKIPSISINHINKTSIKNIVENSDWKKFNQASKTNYNKLIKFFKDNRIDVTKEYPNPEIAKKEKQNEIGGIVEQIYSEKYGINQKELLSRIKYSAQKEVYTYKPPFHIKNKKSPNVQKKGFLKRLEKKIKNKK